MSGIIRKEDMHESFWKEGVSNHNLLINGDFQIWQRGTIFNQISNHKYFADRWKIYNYMSVKSDINKVPGGFCYKSASGSKTLIYQMLEVDDLYPLYNQSLTLSLEYVILNGNPSISCGIRTDSPLYNDGSGVDRVETEYVSSKSERGFLSVTLDNFIYGYKTLMVLIVMDNTSGESDCEVNIRKVKLEVGNKVTSFCPRPYAEELIKCKRFYECGTSLGITDCDFSQYLKGFSYSIEKRVAPTITIVNNQACDINENIIATNLIPNDNKVDNKECSYVRTADNSKKFNVNKLYKYSWIADAEIY